MIIDITERKRSEEEASLLQMMTRIIGESKDFHSALENTLRMVSDKTGWVIGEAWVSSPDGKYLRLSRTWYSKTEALKRFKKESENYTFAPGIGVPGRAWSTKKPVWVSDVTAKGNFLRVSQAREFSLKGTMAIPVLSNEDVVSVMVFFVFKQLDRKDERLIGIVSAIAAQLGALMRQKQFEESLRESEERLRKITASAYDAIVMMNDEGKISFWNEAAERMFLYPRSEALGKNLHELIVAKRFHEDYLKGLKVFKETERSFTQTIP